MVDADLLCAWGICDRSTQSEKDAAGMKGVQGVQEGISAEHHAHISQPSLSASLISSLSPETAVYPIDLKHAGGIWCLAER